MPRVQTTKTNFAKGELAPKAAMRADLNAYGDALKTAVNAQLLAHGGERRRPGTRFVTDLSAKAPVRLETFSIAPGNAYLLVFSEARLDVWTPASATPYWAVTFLFGTTTPLPWTASMIGDLSVVQKGTSMLVCHPALAPHVVTVLGNGNGFKVAPLVFGSGNRDAAAAPSFQPFERFSDTLGVSVTPGAYTGTGITLHASSSLFAGAWVGKIVRYGGTEMKIVSVTDAANAVVDCRETLAKAYDFTVTDNANVLRGQRVKAINGDAEGVVVQTVGTDKVRVLMLDRAQPFEYDASVPNYLVTGTTAVKLTAAGTLVASPPPSPEWDEQSFSNHRGWPTCAAFHEQRLVLARANRLYVSSVADYFNFDPGLGEDDAGFTVDVNQIATIQHMVSFRHLALFTDGGEFYVPQSESTPLTASTISVRPQTAYGASAVRPVTFDGAILFVQRSDRAIREFVYADAETAYASNPISVLSSHLITGPVDMDVQVGASSNEEQYAFVVNADGTLACFHGLRKEEINGWTPWTTQGLFKRVRVVDGTVFLLVERTVNGVPLTYLERLDNGLTLDCAVEAGGASRTVPHLAGSTVHAVKDTAYYGFWPVDLDGQPGAAAPALPDAAEVGLDYPHTLATLPLVMVGGQNVGRVPKRILKCSVWVHESVTFGINGHHLSVYHVGDDFSAPPAAKTGMHAFSLLGWTRDGVVTISQAYPLPLTVLGIQLEVSF